MNDQNDDTKPSEDEFVYHDEKPVELDTRLAPVTEGPGVFERVESSQTSNAVDMSKALEINDVHGWCTVYQNAGRDREVQECRSHGGDPSKACHVRKYREGDNWVIADSAPWVPNEHKEAHAKADAARKAKLPS